MIFNGVEVDVLKLLERWGFDDIHPVGIELNAVCPWKRHRSGGRKFYINTETGMWQCKACGTDRRGDIVWLTRTMESIAKHEAELFLLDHGQEVDPDTFIEHITSTLYEKSSSLIDRKFAKRNAKIAVSILQKTPPRQYGYWQRRGFDFETVRSWGLRFDDYDNTFVIPVTIDHQIVAVIKRTTPRSPERLLRNQMKYVYPKLFNKKTLLFGLDRADAPTLVLTEGPLDCIAVWQALRQMNLLDEYSPVAVLGNSMSEEQAKLVAANADRVICFFDNDESGQRGRLDWSAWNRSETALALNSAIKVIHGVEGIEIANYADSEYKDPGEMLQHDGNDLIVWALLNSYSVSEKRIKENMNGR